ncbi:MAG: hypothetical protein QNK19_08750 [Xanthomonadales bacterium]|nr:hypothetical protein [Xanthomonadales bacterium]
MRLLSIKLMFLVAILVSACDFWPKDLKPLAKSISQQVSGEATAWLVGGDTVVINVAGSPRYRVTQPELEALATEIAGQTIGFSEAQLAAVAISFYEGEVSEDPEKMREFIFLVMENRPVLQPYLDVNATGPLTLDEVQAAIDRLGESVTGEQRECVRGEMQKRAHVAGDPETLDPASMEFLSAVSAETWNDLDAFGKRIILAQAITTKALFFCVSTQKAEVTS